MPPEDDNDQMVPKSRLVAKQAKIEQLEAQLAASKTTAGAGAAAVQALLDAATGTIKTMKNEHKALVLAHATEVTGINTANTEMAALTAAGITDPDFADVARLRYSRLENPDPFSEWIVGATKDDKVLSALTAERAESGDGNTEAKTTTRTSTNTGAGPTPGAGQIMTPAQFRTQQDALLNSGDIKGARELQAKFAGR